MSWRPHWNEERRTWGFNSGSHDLQQIPYHKPISQDLFGCFRRTHISCVIYKIGKGNIRLLISRKDRSLQVRWSHRYLVTRHRWRQGSLATSPSLEVSPRAVKSSSSLEQKRLATATTQTLGVWGAAVTQSHSAVSKDAHLKWTFLCRQWREPCRHYVNAVFWAEAPM